MGWETHRGGGANDPRSLHCQQQQRPVLTCENIDPAMAPSRGQTALMIAAAHGQVAAMRCLVEFGAVVDAVADDGRTALMRVVAGAGEMGPSNAAEAARVLLASAPLDDQWQSGRVRSDFPLHTCAAHNWLELLAVLVGGGGDLSSLNRKGRTPLQEYVLKAGVCRRGCGCCCSGDQTEWSGD